MLPIILGHEICKAMRSEQAETPVIIVARISEVLANVVPLELGPDDCATVTKPFGPTDVVSPLKSSLLSSKNRATPIQAYTFGECEIDFAKMTARRSGQLLPVTTLELKVLKYFVNNAERVLSRQELLDEVWGYNCYPTTRTVDNQILKLRQKLEPNPAEPLYLRTVYRAGYKFVP
jgi:DNA-binding response OmpR family regulator